MENSIVEGQLFLIDKPYRWTSFDVVNKIRYYCKRETGLKKIKVGHAGTLDPLATGLLIVVTGKFTKRIEQLQAGEKEYTGTFILGQTTDSFDLEKEPHYSGEYTHLTGKDLQHAAQKLTGAIMQTPPIFSAVKIDGKRAYEYARKDHEVEMPTKSVEIREFTLTRISLPEVDFRIVCSKGTYIRAIARDFGLLLGCGAYLSALRRTRIGEYNVKDAIGMDNFTHTTSCNGLPLINGPR
ncbi:MAG: tRNA pseudouridine(55) synthase TruB [Bacteroidales bacterium]|jgi:tRNA pseudouridine55 synthase|nr:tRNA pseudouridine(55) synthase TruB [Bacteroidales bacterium]